MGISFILFSIALILTIALYTGIAASNATAFAIEASYTKQDMRYDLNYLVYSALLINYQDNPEEITEYVKSSQIGLNIIIVKNDSLIVKYPKAFFPLKNSEYTIISDSIVHPYQSDSDFKSLTSSLNMESSLPNNIKEVSFGRWENNYYADFIETKDNYRYYLINDSLIEDEGPIESKGGTVFTWGLIIGVLFILVFVALTYNYIRVRLKPIQLMKKRLLDLERGDLESKIKIMGTDELAELSVSFNKLISEIKELINQKHRLLLDVSHELKSPLTRMLLLIEMIPPENKQTQELKEEIAFLNDMISNLLLTDKLDIPYSHLDLGKVNHLEFLNKIVGFFNQEQQEKIHIQSRLPKKTSFIIDQTKLIICIKNIVQNAFKYADTKDGVNISIDQKEEEYYISIRDFGPGISNEDKKHIFESFYRSKDTRSISGFGLGLSISKKIIKAHNGSIIVTSNLSSGTEFVLTLPLGEIF